jgi:pyruvate/2-oxoglutarate dehydrogenase complex dihydrolipoamide acyltransferase (E2) component
VKLGFMSVFVKAAADALKKVPAVNAVIDGDEIIYREYRDISIAVATPKGLVVPVLRNVDTLSFADVEKACPIFCRICWLTLAFIRPNISPPSSFLACAGYRL